MIENVLCHKLGRILIRNCRSSLPRDSLNQTPISPHLKEFIEMKSREILKLVANLQNTINNGIDFIFVELSEIKKVHLKIDFL